MRLRPKADRRRSLPEGRNGGNRTDTVVATLWLAFYVLAIGVAITSPLLSRAIEFAAR